MVLASPCSACGLPLVSLAGSTICDACWASVRVDTPPQCAVCGSPLARGAGEPSACPLPHRTVLTLSRSVGPYAGSLRAIVHAFKYDGHESLAEPLAAWMRVRGSEALTGAHACVPVPLHWRRHLARGFNQADLLARGLGLPVWHVLRRHRHTATQASLHADARSGNVAGAFRLRRVAYVTTPVSPGGGGWWTPRRWVSAAALVRGAVIVLVDDVRTTGATLDACARTLLRAGAAEVRSLTVSRVEGRAAR